MSKGMRRGGAKINEVKPTMNTRVATSGMMKSRAMP